LICSFVFFPYRAPSLAKAGWKVCFYESRSSRSQAFTNEINLAISRASRSARPVRLLGPFRAELEHWLFLESWEGFLPWRSEFHRQVTLYSDASRFAWGGSFPGAFPRCISNYWDRSSISYDIAVK